MCVCVRAAVCISAECNYKLKMDKFLIKKPKSVVVPAAPPIAVLISLKGLQPPAGLWPPVTYAHFCYPCSS